MPSDTLPSVNKTTLTGGPSNSMRLRRDSYTGKFLSHNLGFAAGQTRLRSALAGRANGGRVGSLVSFASFPGKRRLSLPRVSECKWHNLVTPPGTLWCSHQPLLSPWFGASRRGRSQPDVVCSWAAAGSRAWAPGGLVRGELHWKKLSALYP